MNNQHENAIGIIYLLLTGLCWSFVASTVKRLTGKIDPYTISFLRVSLATAVFAMLFIIQKGDRRRLPWTSPWIWVGALGRASNYLFYNLGLQYTPSNAVTILAPVQGIGTVLMARVLLRERINGKWSGILLALGGLLLIGWNGKSWSALTDPCNLGGNLLLILAGLASAFQFTAQKAMSGRHSGVEILLPVFVLSSVITAPFAWLAGGFGQSYAPSTWGWALFLGLGLTGGSFFLLGEGYKRCVASTAVVLTNTSTFWVLIWSVLLLKESIGAAMIAGTVLGIAGTLAVIRADQKQIPPADR